MNKKEFIETLIDMGGCGAKPKSWARGWDDAISEVLGIAEELDELEKPVIPQFVADWIEKQMKFGYEDVFISMTRLRERAPEKVKFWFRNNSDTYARAWLDGYEVEKEKKRVVKKRKLYLKSFDIWREECNNAEFFFDKESTIKFTDKAKAEAVAETPDIINEPNHYKGKHGIETIDVIRNFGNDDMIAGFYWGNAIKYMTRYRNKNGLEDLKKARKNLDWLIEHMEE